MMHPTIRCSGLPLCEWCAYDGGREVRMLDAHIAALTEDATRRTMRLRSYGAPNGWDVVTPMRCHEDCACQA